MRSLVLWSSVFLLSACTWVDLNTSGERVSVVTAELAQMCRPVGKAHAQVMDTAAGFKRSAEKVAKELETIARNTAADLGGNAIVPVSPVVDGKRDYDVFQCSVPPTK